MNRWLAAGLLVILAFGMVRAQESTASAQFFAPNATPLVGEPVLLVLSAAFMPGTTLVQWPDFPQQWGVFEVRDAAELNIAEQNGVVEYRQDLTVVLWEPGDFITPETTIIYMDANGNLANLYVQALPFTVPSVLTDDRTLRPLKPLVFLSYIPRPLVIGVILVVAVAAIWFIQRRRRPVKAAADWQGDIRELDRRMLAALNAIGRQALEPSAVYAATADCLRDYLGQQFGVAAQELTTAELLANVQPHLSKSLLNRLGQLLGQADLVKFARQIPGQESARQYLETAAQWIQAVSREGQDSEERAERL
jgi:hypothetical protein